MKEPLELLDKQITLLQILNEKDTRLGSMYKAALIVIKCETMENERFVLAAHNIRELMEKLPKHIDVDIPGPRNYYPLIKKQTELFQHAKQSTTFNDNKWCGFIDDILKNFLIETERICSKFIQMEDERSKRFSKALCNFGGWEQQLPSVLRKQNENLWKQMMNFFVAVCHHKRMSSEEEFLQYLSMLEDFLINQLEPKVFEDFDLIDSIIEEGEAN